MLGHVELDEPRSSMASVTSARDAAPPPSPWPRAAARPRAPPDGHAARRRPSARARARRVVARAGIDPPCRAAATASLRDSVAGHRAPSVSAAAAASCRARSSWLVAPGVLACGRPLPPGAAVRVALVGDASRAGAPRPARRRRLARAAADRRASCRLAAAAIARARPSSGCHRPPRRRCRSAGRPGATPPPASRTTPSSVTSAPARVDHPPARRQRRRAARAPRRGRAPTASAPGGASRAPLGSRRMASASATATAPPAAGQLRRCVSARRRARPCAGTRGAPACRAPRGRLGATASAIDVSHADGHVARARPRRRGAAPGRPRDRPPTAPPAAPVPTRSSGSSRPASRAVRRAPAMAARRVRASIARGRGVVGQRASAPPRRAAVERSPARLRRLDRLARSARGPPRPSRRSLAAAAAPASVLLLGDRSRRPAAPARPARRPASGIAHARTLEIASMLFASAAWPRRPASATPTTSGASSASPRSTAASRASRRRASSDTVWPRAASVPRSSGVPPRATRASVALCRRRASRSRSSPACSAVSARLGQAKLAPSASWRRPASPVPCAPPRRARPSSRERDAAACSSAARRSPRAASASAWAAASAAPVACAAVERAAEPVARRRHERRRRARCRRDRRASCCSAWAASRRACGRSSARRSRTRSRFASASASSCLRRPPPPLVPADAGRLLEERPALLRPQRERLVDHALADEQEGVVGQVGIVEQVDEVAQPDALAVEQVLVLARPEEPPPQLDLAEVDRQQPVLVVDDERHVGHADGPPRRRAGEDDVLGPPRAQRPALLAQRPAQRVGEVALAAAVGAHDGADARSELDPVRSAKDLKPTMRSARSRATLTSFPCSRPATSWATNSRSSAEAPVRPSASSALGGRRLCLAAVAALAAARALAVDARPRRRSAWSWSGPSALHDAVGGGRPGRRVGVLLEPALGRLQRADRHVRPRARAPAHARSQRRAASRPRSR